jgi:hypothetical protein
MLALLLGPAVLADCGCPPTADSTRLLITVGTSANGLVACGYEDERRARSVVASEFQIFRCAGTEPLMEFGALRKAILRNRGSVLQVTEVEEWPFGKQWKWVLVPVYEWHLSVDDPQPKVFRTLTATPQATRAEIDALVREYRHWLSQPRATRSYYSLETYVARLFTAAIAGDRDANALFLTMSEDDVGLDGASSETYHLAMATYEAWKRLRVRMGKE